jgi:hypothetical protein
MFMKRTQQGTSLLIVLVLLSVMLMAVITMARLSESSTMIAGNMSNNDLSVQSSAIGINDAMANLDALAALDVSAVDGDGKVWYLPTMRDDNLVEADEAFWDARPTVTVGKGGQFTVRYIVERLCRATPVSDPQSQCLLRRKASPVLSANGDPEVNPPAYRQYRITVRVDAPKGGRSFFQAVATQ